MIENVEQLVWGAQKLIWEGQQEALNNYPLIPPTTWAGSIQRDIIEFSRSSDPLLWPAVQQDPFLHVAVIMMVKDESDIIRQNLLWLYFVGVRRFVIIDNNSSDSTPEIIKDFSKSSADIEMLSIHDPLIHYFQKEKTTGMFHFARSVWPDLKWVFPIDADEFLIPQQGFDPLEGLSPEIDAITIPKVIHCLSGEPIEYGQDALFNMPVRTLLGAVPPKVAVRVNSEASIEQGNHFVSFPQGRSPIHASGLCLGFYYREFPTRSFAQFLRKVRNGGAAIQAAKKYDPLRSCGGEHWIAYYETLANGGEEALFQVFQAQFVHTPADGAWTTDPFPGYRQNDRMIVRAQ